MLSIHNRRNTNVGGGTVDVRNTDLIDELYLDENDYIRTKSVVLRAGNSRKSRSRRPQTTTTTSSKVKLHLVLPSSSCCGPSNMRPSTMDADTLIGHTLKLQDWLNEKQVKSVQSPEPRTQKIRFKNFQVSRTKPGFVLIEYDESPLKEKADLESKDTRKLYSDVLETENTFVKDLGDMLTHKDKLERRKKEMLHKKWSENVYEPIRKQVDGQMHGPGYREMARRKRQLHKEYLEHVNKKGHVFLDTIAPDEYYAMSLHPTRPSLLTAYTKTLKDPLLNQERARASEDRVIYRCEMGSALTDRELQMMRLPQLPLVPLGRHGTECRTWLEMPMGDIESPVRMASRNRFKPMSNESQIDFPRWAKLQFRTGQVDEELKVQRKRMYTQELPNDRTLSHPAVTTNCGGPETSPRWRGVPRQQPISAPADLREFTYDVECN